jgi:hypothetical protein
MAVRSLLSAALLALATVPRAFAQGSGYVSDPTYPSRASTYIQMLAAY